MIHWTVEKTLEINPRARRLEREHPEAVLLAYAADQIHEDMVYLARWRQQSPATRGLSDPLHHDLEPFFARIIDGLIDAGAAGLSQRFAELAQATHDSQIRARTDPEAAATAEYLADAGTAIGEYDARLTELRWWCHRRFEAIWRARNNAEGEAIKGSAHRPPLKGHALAVYELLRELPEHRCMSGPEICDALTRLDPPVHIDETTLRNHVIPKLREHYSVRNFKNLGYCIRQ